MRSSEVRVYAIHEGYICVVADMMAYSKEWPETISADGKLYKFGSNEVMEDWMIGNVSGHAKYVEISESATQSAGVAE